jgi:hypothetical protein
MYRPHKNGGKIPDSVKSIKHCSAQHHTKMYKIMKKITQN